MNIYDNICDIDREIERIRIEEKCGSYPDVTKAPKGRPIKTPCDTCERKTVCTWDDFIKCEKG